MSRGTVGRGSCEPTAVETLLRDWADGRIKLHVLRRALQLRRALPLLFARGSYEPLEVRGERSEHAVAFLRRHESGVAVIAVGRFFAALQVRDEEPAALHWGDSVLYVADLGHADLIDAFTGRRIVAAAVRGPSEIPLRSLFGTLPIAALTPTSTRPPPRHPRSASPP
jgi:(1->4)-alpha-D-glucan 1-alpha-D-glucosylmutase